MAYVQEVLHQTLQTPIYSLVSGAQLLAPTSPVADFDRDRDGKDSTPISIPVVNSNPTSEVQILAPVSLITVPRTYDSSAAINFSMENSMLPLGNFIEQVVGQKQEASTENPKMDVCYEGLKLHKQNQDCFEIVNAQIQKQNQETSKLPVGNLVEHVVCNPMTRVSQDISCESQIFETLMASDHVKGGYHKARKKDPDSLTKNIIKQVIYCSQSRSIKQMERVSGLQFQPSLSKQNSQEPKATRTLDPLEVWPPKTLVENKTSNDGISSHVVLGDTQTWSVFKRKLVVLVTTTPRAGDDHKLLNYNNFKGWKFKLMGVKNMCEWVYDKGKMKLRDDAKVYTNGKTDRLQEVREILIGAKEDYKQRISNSRDKTLRCGLYQLARSFQLEDKLVFREGSIDRLWSIVQSG